MKIDGVIRQITPGAVKMDQTSFLFIISGKYIASGYLNE